MLPNASINDCKGTKQVEQLEPSQNVAWCDCMWMYVKWIFWYLYLIDPFRTSQPHRQTSGATWCNIPAKSHKPRCCHCSWKQRDASGFLASWFPLMFGWSLGWVLWVMIVQSFWCVLVFLAPSYNLTLQTFQMSGHKCSKSEVSYKTFLKYIIDSSLQIKALEPKKSAVKWLKTQTNRGLYTRCRWGQLRNKLPGKRVQA